MNRKMNRRESLAAAAITGVSLYHGGSSRRISAAESPNEKLNIACIGVGGRGQANVAGLKSQNFVAFADVDEKRAAKSFERYPKTKRFSDFRRLLDKIGGELDAVAISTPDHTHFHPALAAMQLGLHVYLEKPLAHNVWETRTLTELAGKQRIALSLRLAILVGLWHR